MKRWAPKTSAAPIRRGLLAKIHIARKDLALQDDSYRALLMRETGKESAGDCSIAELEKVAQAFRSLGWTAKRRAGPKRAGSVPLAMKNEAPKIRALWLSLYHLGEVADPSEAALAAFVARMTKSRHAPAGIERLQFLDGASADRVIKALRGWCERVGFRQPEGVDVHAICDARRATGMAPVDTGVAAKMMLIDRQWELLRELGAFRQPVFANLESFLWKYYGCRMPAWIDPARADDCIERLGRWVRKQKAEAGNQKPEGSQDAG